MTTITQPGPRPAGGGARRVVVAGAGFGGPAAVTRLARAEAQTTVIDRNICSTFQPLRYQVATGALTGSDLAYPVRATPRRYGAVFRYPGPHAGPGNPQSGGHSPSIPRATPKEITMATIIAAWAAVWILIAATVTVTGLRRGRPMPTAAWLVTIGAFLAAQEDPLLIIQMASGRPTPGNRDGVLGLVHAHTRGHMYGAAILALAGLGLAVVIAHAALRRREVWAWWALAGFWLAGTAADLVEVFGIYPHGFPLGPTPADGVRGFGWPTLAAWMVIWAAGLVVAAAALLARQRRPQQVTAPVAAP